MTELIECGPMPIDLFEISLGRQHLDEIAVVSPTSAARRRSSFGVKRSALKTVVPRSPFLTWPESTC